ncbi:MAG: hypothetical protein Ct9H300mP12_10200 [Acidimicrobiales bacterium]|nr:MAG: hypothetical protein Ct9H300mP12_10200 [Acidimicrobiales bacterium]
MATQNVTDPTLADRVFERLEAGETATEAVAAVMDGRVNADYRQLAVVDMAGRTGHFTGSHILGTNRVVEGDHCIAAGNLLSTLEVPAAMVAGFEADPEAHLADRLLRGLEAGLAAGGEEGPVRSAALVVHHDQPFALVDLRCDWDEDDPVVVLRRLWTDYEPQMQPYLARGRESGGSAQLRRGRRPVSRYRC